uniref:Uncharacterized protein n=1 Tax=Anguilla anguilla TaxID=7936 RepID=A0A0E9XZW8_ANGAN
MQRNQTNQKEHEGHKTQRKLILNVFGWGDYGGKKSPHEEQGQPLN